MAVQREAAISAFTPEKFYTVLLAFVGGGTASSKRFSQKADAERLLTRCRKEVQTTVQKVERKEKAEKPPQLYDLTTLQRDANRLLGFTAQQTLNYAQSLYEKKLTTYPRTDCRYLPEEHFAGRHAVLNAIAVHAADLLPQPVMDPEIRNRCWDDKKVDAHHAIIPTARSSAINLTENEAKVYNLIARQYLMQFCPDAVFRKCVIELDIAKGKFVAKARFLAEAGWRTLLGSKERDEENDGTPLPVVAKGDELLCEKGEVVERQTQPPRHFTDATLLSAMTGIAQRAAGTWQSEWEPLVELLRLVAAAASGAERLLGGLQVHPERMRANVELTGGLVMAESASAALAGELGRGPAQQLVKRLCEQAVARGTSLRAELLADDEVRAVLSEQDVVAATEPADHLGSAREFVDRALSAHSGREHA